MSLEKPFNEKENKKTEFFSSFAMGNLEAMRLLRKFGLLKGLKEEKNKSAWGMLQGKERSFRNISEHCLVVGATADVIFEKLAEKGYLTPEERKIGTKAAILHDMTKRQELEITKGIQEGKESEIVDPKEIKKLTESSFTEYGISEKDREAYNLSDLCSGGFFNFNEAEVKPLASSRDIIRWTVTLSDWMVAHTTLVSPNARFKEMIKRGEYDREYLWWYKQFYKDDVGVDNKDPEQIKEAVFGKIVPILDKAEEELKGAIGVPPEQRLVNFVKDEFDKKFSVNPNEVIVSSKN